MQAPSTSAAPVPVPLPVTPVTAVTAPAAPTATEVVHRPDPGVARGKWEAAPWMFYTALAVIVIGASVYLLRRMGMLRFGKKKA